MSDKPERLSDERLERICQEVEERYQVAKRWGSDSSTLFCSIGEFRALVTEVIEARAKMRKCPCCNPTRRHGEVIPCDAPLDKS